MSSEDFGFKAFTKEVKKRENKQNIKKIFYLALVLIGCGILRTDFSAKPNKPLTEIKKPLNDSYQTDFSDNSEFQGTRYQRNWDDSLALANSVARAFLPETQVLEGIKLTNRDTNSSTFRIFLREPKPEENSPVKKNCNSDNTNHYFLQFTDYSTDKPIATAFIRANEMLKLYLLVGLYKIRYAAGKAEDWKGKEDLFGNKYIYELRDKELPAQARKFDIRSNYGIDLGVFCVNSTSKSEPILKENVQLNPTM